jgi:hypothetical protein
MKTSIKVITAATDVVVVGTGIATGVVVALAMAGIATSVVGKVIGGLFTYAIVSSAATRAGEAITEPIVNLLIENHIDDEKQDS